MGKRGHPVLIKSTVIKKALENNSYSNLREFIEYNFPKLVPVVCSGILIDADTEKDYKNIINIGTNK
jgi:CTP:molybdopterin cytidylyltransferase MocA